MALSITRALVPCAAAPQERWGFAPPLHKSAGASHRRSTRALVLRTRALCLSALWRLRPPALFGFAPTCSCGAAAVPLAARSRTSLRSVRDPLITATPHLAALGSGSSDALRPRTSLRSVRGPLIHCDPAPRCARFGAGSSFHLSLAPQELCCFATGRCASQRFGGCASSAVRLRAFGSCGAVVGRSSDGDPDRIRTDDLRRDRATC